MPERAAGNHFAHDKGEQWRREDKGDPEAPRHVIQFAGILLGRHRFRFERHAADRAACIGSFAYLRMHGTGPDGAGIADRNLVIGIIGLLWSGLIVVMARMSGMGVRSVVGHGSDSFSRSASQDEGMHHFCALLFRLKKLNKGTNRRAMYQP